MSNNTINSTARQGGNLRAQLFDLADQDREALALIRQKLEIGSSALAVRLAIRNLARRLSDPQILARSYHE